ncbi:MAG: polymerase [Dehalococcoidia bacterium]|nr:polymerase [Dehalococcoidia bacterium]
MTSWLTLPMINMDRRILHLDLDAFFVSVEQSLNPSLRGKPVVVGGQPGKRGVVASASYEARAFGLYAGMPLASAHRLCPHAIFIPGSFSHYREASAGFFRILADYTPDIEAGGLDEAYLDVTGLLPGFDSAFHMAQQIKHRVRRELDLIVSVGIANSKVVAKIASDLGKPDGLIEVTKGAERSFLAPLAIGKMPGVGEKTERLMKGLGIATIGQLADTPPAALKNRLGQWGETLHRHAMGIDDRKVEPPGEAKSISRETTFAADTLEEGFIKATLRYLAERVGADLRQHAKRAKCVTIKVRFSDFETITRQCAIPEASDSDQAIYEAGLRLLARAFHYRRARVRLLGIGVSSLQDPGQQLHLWDFTDEKAARLNRTVDQLRKKYGFTSIQTGQTRRLKEDYPDSPDRDGYRLHTPSLSR